MFKKIFILSIILLALTVASPSQAAAIYLTPSQSSIDVGDTVNVFLRIDSGEEKINAAQATLNFPTNILSVKSVSKGDSIFNFWLEEPTFNNSAGVLSFIGGSTSGYSGKALIILSVEFEVVGKGSAALFLSGAAITASDGSGTNILELTQGLNLKGAEETIPEPVIEVPTETSTPVPAAPEVVVIEEEVVALPPSLPVPTPQEIVRPAVKARSLPAVPKVEVPFYADSEKWYNATANFLVKWELPADINKVATALNNDPDFDPKVAEGVFDNKFFESPAEGINYLHIVFRNSVGWGDTAHYRIAIDTVPPAPFRISAEKGMTTEYPKQRISFSSNDDASGIDGYIVTVDNEPPVFTHDTFYDLPVLKPGNHVVKVGARDMASNVTEAVANITVLPIASPKISSISEDVFIGEGELAVFGSALSSVSIILNLKNSSGDTLFSKTVVSDISGKWNATFDEPLKKGTYFIEVTAQDEREAVSLPIKSKDIRVRVKPIAVVFGLEITALFFYGAIILILFGGFVAGFLFYYLWRGQLARRVFIAERDVVNSFSSIEEKISKVLKKYKGKKLTPTESREIKIELKKLKNNIQKHKNYLIENIKEISD